MIRITWSKWFSNFDVEFHILGNPTKNVYHKQDPKQEQ
jgi:hypothetical protein